MYWLLIAEEMKQLRSETTKYDETKGRENKWSVSSWVKTALKSYGRWNNQVKVGSLKEIATDGSNC